MSYKVWMQKELDELNLKISELENTLRVMKYKNNVDQEMLRELEQSYKRKGILKQTLEVLGQYGGSMKKIEIEQASNGYIITDQLGNITLQPSFTETIDFLKIVFDEI